MHKKRPEKYIAKCVCCFFKQNVNSSYLWVVEL